MMPNDIEYAQIVEADSIVAHGKEYPSLQGLQVLSYKEVKSIFEWIDEHAEPSKLTDWKLTSEVLSQKCTRDLSKDGTCKNVNNLQMKSAMFLCGFEPVTYPVEIQHYRVKFIK